MTAPGFVVLCEWYVRCDHPAVGFTSHPILGDVPICQRCAERHDLPVTPFQWVTLRGVSK